MKHTNGLLRFAALLMTAVVLLSMIPALSASAADRTFKEKEIPAYYFSMKNTDKLDCLISSDMPSMPYVSVMDYLGKVFGDSFKIAETAGGVYKITGSTEKNMVIDTNRGTVSFDCFENFFPMQTTDADNDGAEAPYIKEHKIIVDGEAKPLSLDFGKYGIDLFSKNGKVYFPLTTLSNLFAGTHISALYLGGKIYFTLSSEEPYFDNSEIYKTTVRSADLIGYTYRELCFDLDNYFGFPEKSQLGKMIKENGGFDSLMNNTEFGKNVKPLLLSKSMTDYYTGLILIDSMLDDGGHSSLSANYTLAMIDKPDAAFSAEIKAMMDDPKNAGAAAIAANMKAFLDHGKAEEELVNLRTGIYAGQEIIKTWETPSADGKSGEPYARLVKCGDTAVFVFNTFKDEIVAPFKQSLDYAQEKGLKNFVIDLTCNGGGSSAVMMYMASVLTGSADIHVRNTINGVKVLDTGKVDKNLDKVVDEKDDAVHYDLRFAILTSRNSFSCANLLPCIAQEYRIPIIGETSGGGTCFLLDLSLPDATAFSLSGYRMMLNNKGKDVESGAKVDLEAVTVDKDGNADYSKLYDMNAVSAFLDQYYAKVTPLRAKASVTPALVKAPSPIGTVLLIAIPSVLFLTALAIVIIVIKKHSKKNTPEVSPF